MTHEQAHALLLDLAYGELAPEELEEVSRHAAGCSDCAAELERIAAVRAAAAALAEGPGPARSREALVEAARRAVATRPTRRWFTRPATLSFGAAAAVLFIVAGVTLRLTGDGVHRPGEGGDLTASAPLAPPSAPADAPPPAAPALAPQQSPAPEAAAPAVRSAPRRSKAAAPEELAAAPAPAAEAPAPVTAAAPAPAAPPRALAAPSAGSAAAPAPSARAAARVRSADAETGATRDEVTDPRHVAEELERRRAAGELTEVRRQLRCGDARVERTALVDRDGRVVQVSERRGAAWVEGWYDAAGRLVRTSGSGAETLPRQAPTVEALEARCGW